ncbi:hypothetical protein [Cellulomonas iranensis]|uniref:Uncharacterized protein n=1 Tax=Cellulomonas iranensis TaxID=76862 RepID=A0ABU0GN69_9CELL|nr:hypothetical protein [Cellulomonas iranensis]MDQ0426025.1 hypothetical protein [Cellulomonas iranensis]
MDTNDSTAELHLSDGGLWAVRSTSATVCYLDLDRMRLYRDRGPGSPVFFYDGRWVPLVQVRSSRGDRGVVRVGDRHEFLTDPEGAHRAGFCRRRDLRDVRRRDATGRDEGH